jgi:hypothetical protein
MWRPSSGTTGTMTARLKYVSSGLLLWKERGPTGPLRHEKRQIHLLPARCDRHVLDPVVLRERGQLRRIEWKWLDHYVQAPGKIRRQETVQSP